MGFKDYDAMLAEQIGGRPVFKAAGRTWTCRARLPWKKFSKMMLSLTVSTAVGEQSLEETEEFFRLVLTAKDRQAFIDLLNFEGDDDDEEDIRVIHPSQVGAIIDDLLEHYSGKATPNDFDSTDKPPAAGQPSNVVSLTPQGATV